MSGHAGRGGIDPRDPAGLTGGRPDRTEALVGRRAWTLWDRHRAERATGPRVVHPDALAEPRNPRPSVGHQRPIWSPPPQKPSAVACRPWPPPQLVTARRRLRQHSDWDTETTATAASLHALARRIQRLDHETAQHTRAITTLVQAWRAELLTRCGIGPIMAASVLCAWSHAGRSRSEAAFAILGGTAPIPAPAARPRALGATGPGTASSTRPCTSSS